jgi:hypothetical protein
VIASFRQGIAIRRIRIHLVARANSREDAR